MRVIILMTVCIGFGALAGCTRTALSSSIYEGLKAREAIDHPATGIRPAQGGISYSEYEARRQNHLNGDDAH